MSRLAAQADLNYVPIPSPVITLIATFVAPAPVDARLLDVCAGEGAAATQLARALGLPRTALFLNELHPTRAQQCRAVAPAMQVLQGDALTDLQISRSFCQLLYLNPPFAWQGREQGGERLELHFFQRAVERGRWLQPGGLAIYVCPGRVVRRPTVVRHLARCFDAVRVVRFPDTHRHFGEVVVFGVRRADDRVGRALVAEAARLDAAMLATDLPVLTAQETPIYQLPAPAPLSQPVIFRLASTPDPLAAAQDVATTGGAWASPAARRTSQHLHRTHAQRRPLFPLNPTQAALQIAAGAINNQPITVGDRIFLIKGGAIESVHVVERTLDDDRVERRRTRSRTPRVTLLDAATGAISVYIGAEGMQPYVLDYPWTDRHPKTRCMKGGRQGHINAQQTDKPPDQPARAAINRGPVTTGKLDSRPEARSPHRVRLLSAGRPTSRRVAAAPRALHFPHVYVACAA